MTLSSIQLLED